MLKIDGFRTLLEVGLLKRRSAKHISKPKVLKTEGLGALFEVRVCLLRGSAMDSAHPRKRAKRDGVVGVSKVLAGVGHVKQICKDAFCMAWAVQETHESDRFGGPGSDFFRGAAIRASDLQVC